MADTPTITKNDIISEIEIFKNAKGTLVQDSLIRILEMIVNFIDDGNSQ